MERYFLLSREQRLKTRAELREIRREILAKVEGAGIASDQFARLFDLAIDFSEDVKPLSTAKIKKIVDIFHAHGATAKVSNIHVNGWFGDYDKVSTCRSYLMKEFKMNEKQMREQCIFVGDSPNDEPMFEFFPNTFAVANIKDFLPQLKSKPSYLAPSAEGHGFVEVAERVLHMLRK